jgi:predicted dehydrogenase
MTEPATDRRSFLRQASALSLAATLAESAAADEPIEKVRTAVVGTGGRGSDLIRSLSTIPRCDLVAVCDDYAPHLEQGLKYAGDGAAGFTDFAQMLRDVKPQAVLIATPLPRHAEMCLAALDAGCAVFCEKTMCYTVAEAREVAAAVERRQAVFQVGLQRRANAVYRQAQAMVQAGMLGQITAVKCQWNRNNNWRRPVPVRRDADDWASLEARLNWRLYRKSSGGLMTELASHQLDVVNWLLGATPARVVGSGGIDYWRDGRDVFDNLCCIYEYELKPPVDKRNPPAAVEPYTARVTYSSLQNNAYEGCSELVLGTKGTLFLTSKKGLFYQENLTANPGWAGEGRAREDAALIASGKTLKMTNDPWSHRGKPYEIDTDGDDTRDELVTFLQCAARNDPATICDARTGLQNTATVLMANDAMTERREVAFPDLR